MKKVLLIILVPFLAFAQKYSYPVELYFITENAPPTPIITCTLTAQAQCWGDLSGNTCVEGHGEYFLTDDYDDVTYVPSGNNLGDNSAGFDFITAQNGYPTFAYGIYKVTNNVSSKYFYLDYRDYRVGYYNCYDPPPYGHQIDVWLKYDYSNDIFSYKSGSPDNVYHNIANGQLLNIWDIKHKGNQLTSLFPSYWINCLAAINNGNNHPKLVWGPYQESLPGPIVNYRIYYNDHPSYAPPGPFSLLYEVGANVYNYVDENVTIGNGFNKRSYIVKAVYIVDLDTYTETIPTNVASVSLTPPSKIQERDDKESLPGNYMLQNYPNPFNPNTKIEYSVKKDGFVILKVYDILGNEVASLVNEKKPAGKYFVEFNTSDLPSGTYFYRITTGDFVNSKKMILLK